VTDNLKLIEDSVQYLKSEEAMQRLKADPYWPKWNSPWWHMSLLHEMGETKRIPSLTIQNYIESLNQMPLKIFPIHPHDNPKGVDPYRGSPCHCQLGNVYQVLAAWGVSVDDEIPWIRPWFLRYQMADGGLSCDGEAYLVKDEIPSSMVGTISAFEAILLYTPRPWTSSEKDFLDRAAKFLMDRKLLNGSSTRHNSSERESAKKWVKLCFPRFYLYDVLRGLNAILLWSEKTGGHIPHESVSDVINYLSQQFPDGQIRIGRHSFEGTKTFVQSSSGDWLRMQPPSFFPLLNEVSKIGQVSPYLTKQWGDSLTRISKLQSLR